MTTIEYKIFPEIFHDTGEIHLKCQMLAERFSVEVMKTKEAAIRSALIALGWTPPEQPTEKALQEAYVHTCAHDITSPEVFQYPGDRTNRACWTLASKCRKCGDVFIFDSQFGFFSDLYKEIR